MSSRGRLHIAVDLAILVVLALVLLQPRGVIGSRITEWRSARQLEARIAEHWDELAERDGSILGESANGSPPLVEFVDYQCPSCRTIAPDVEALASEGIPVAIRHLPVPVGPYSRAAAKAAICAAEQGRFQQMHGLLFEIDWARMDGEPAWRDLAASAGVPLLDVFGECLESDRVEQRLARDRRLADLLGLRGTPTFVTPSRVHMGATRAAEAFAAAREARDP